MSVNPTDSTYPQSAPAGRQLRAVLKRPQNLKFFGLKLHYLLLV